MTDKPCINIVVSEDLPERYRRLVTIDDNSGVVVRLVAHVPEPSYAIEDCMVQAASGQTWAV